MNKRRVFSVMILIMIMVTVINVLPAECSIEDSPLKKLGRGALNIVFGWFEVILQPAAQENPYDIFLGVFKGFGCAVGRTAVGVYDVATFPIPIPAGYKSIVEPEFVFDVVGGNSTE